MAQRPELAQQSTSRAEPDQRGIAMIFALMLIMIIGMFSLILLSKVISEVHQTEFARKHTQTVNSAAAGMNVVLNELRNSMDSATGVGVIAYLPCNIGSNHGSLSGPVDASGSQTWSADVYYLSTDPTKMTTTQVGTSPGTLSCPLNQVPKYAYIVSSGHQSAIPGYSTTFGDRTLRATYRFTTSNATTVGGPILYSGNCWDVGSSPGIGSQVTFQACAAAGAPTQSWYYRPDLSLFWQGNPSANLCLDYRSLATSATIYYLTLQTCLGSGATGGAYNTSTNSYYAAGQMYQEFASDSYWNAVTASGDEDYNNAVNSYHAVGNSYGAGSVGDLLVMTTTGGGAAYASGTSAVGAGAASGTTNGLPSATTQQLVSLGAFSRCLDIVGSAPSNGLFHFACHQSPNPSNVGGNQEFQYSGTTQAPGTLQSYRPASNCPSWWGPSCAYSTVCFDSGAGAVNLVSCVAAKASQQWQLTGLVPGHYSDSYLIRDYLGRCLNDNSGTVTLATCDGSNLQKWNAPPGGTQSQLGGFGEQ